MIAQSSLQSLLAAMTAKKVTPSNTTAVQPARQVRPTQHAPQVRQQVSTQQVLQPTLTQRQPNHARPSMGLRPESLKGRVGKMPTQVFEWTLEAVWTSPNSYRMDVLCWAHQDGSLETIQAFGGDPSAVGFQTHKVWLDDVGFYRLVQIQVDPIAGTWHRVFEIPRSGSRYHLRACSAVRTLWADIAPKRLEQLVTGPALHLLEVEKRDETDMQYFNRRVGDAQRSAAASRRR